jgi:hypothetical protein
MGAAVLIQGSSPKSKCCRGENSRKGISREHVIFVWPVGIEIAGKGSYSIGESKPKRG